MSLEILIALLIGIVLGSAGTLAVAFAWALWYCDPKKVVARVLGRFREQNVERTEGMILEPMDDDEAHRLETEEWNPLRDRLKEAESDER